MQNSRISFEPRRRYGQGTGGYHPIETSVGGNFGKGKEDERTGCWKQYIRKKSKIHKVGKRRPLDGVTRHFQTGQWKIIATKRETGTWRSSGGNPHTEKTVDGHRGHREMLKESRKRKRKEKPVPTVNKGK